MCDQCVITDLPSNAPQPDTGGEIRCSGAWMMRYAWVLEGTPEVLWSVRVGAMEVRPCCAGSPCLPWLLLSL